MASLIIAEEEEGMSKANQMSEQEQQQWIREQYQVATKFLAAKGLITDSVVNSDSRYLVPFVSLWSIKLADKSRVWVIAGDLPTDYAPLSVAKDAREAIRHFSFKWQMQADQLLKSSDEEQQKFAQVLIGRAEGLYDLFEKDAIWQAQTA